MRMLEPEENPRDEEMEGLLDGLVGNPARIPVVDSREDHYRFGYETGRAQRQDLISEGKTPSDIKRLAEIRAGGYLDGWINAMTGDPGPNTWREAERRLRRRH